jgi:hypothetical protein
MVSQLFGKLTPNTYASLFWYLEIIWRYRLYPVNGPSGLCVFYAMKEAGQVPRIGKVFNKGYCSKPAVLYMLTEFYTITKSQTIIFHIMYERPNFITTQSNRSN